MRISDWSSDVCSSGLPERRFGSGAEQLVEAQGGASGEDDVVCAVHEPGAGEVAHGSLHRIALGELLGVVGDRAGHLGDGDRKTVVYGQRLSVRVDLGGRRIITKTDVRYSTNQT